MGPLAASPATAELLLGVPTLSAFAWPRPTGPKADRGGSVNSDIMLRDIGGAAIASLRDDSGTSEHGCRQQSENGDLHGSGRPWSRSATAVGTKTGIVPGWKVRR